MHADNLYRLQLCSTMMLTMAVKPQYSLETRCGQTVTLKKETQLSDTVYYVRLKNYTGGTLELTWPDCVTQHNAVVHSIICRFSQFIQPRC